MKIYVIVCHGNAVEAFTDYDDAWEFARKRYDNHPNLVVERLKLRDLKKEKYLELKKIYGDE